MPTEGIRIFFYPSDPGLNPYYPLLEESVRDRDTLVTVDRLDLERVGIIKLARMTRGKVVLHLHWIPELAARGNNLTSIWQYRRIIRAFLLIYILKIFRRVKIVWTVHNADQLHSQPLWTSFFSRCAEYLTDSYIFHCSIARHDYFRRPQAKPTYVIPHGHNVGEYGPVVHDRVRARALFGIPSDAATFLLLGWQRKYKRLDWLLPALHEFPNENVRFIVIGMTVGGDFSLPASILTDRRFIIIPKMIAPGYIRWVTAASDFLINAQRRGYVSGVTMLALSYGLPVISVKWGCASSIVRHMENGFLFGRLNLHNRLEMAIRVKKDRTRYSQMSAAALRSARKYDWKKIGMKTWGVYQEALEA